MSKSTNISRLTAMTDEECRSLARLAEHSAYADANQIWPEDSWTIMQSLNAERWAIPADYGGAGQDSEGLLRRYYDTAGHCLTSCFILTQRDAAVRRILMSGNESLCRELLPPLANGDRFATVGLSQLTTSRQHVAPRFVGEETHSGFRFHGGIPWVTGASHANFVVVGATLPDNRQVLCVLPMDSSGVSVGEPVNLMALQGSVTAEIYCDNVQVNSRWLLAGPVENVMKGKQSGAGGLQTSCLALGLANAAIGYLQQEARARPQLSPCAGTFDERLSRLRETLFTFARKGAANEAIIDLRAAANVLVVQACQAAMIAAKGTGFAREHPVQQWLRQAMFFLVWSCPWPAASATMELLTKTHGGEVED